MNSYRVYGADRETGEARVVDIKGVDERAALDAVYEDGVVVERIVLVKKNKYYRDGSKPKTVATLSGIVPESDIQRPKGRDFLSTELPFFGEGRRNYKDRGVNTVGEIAAGVFFGLTIFTCFSPLIVFVVFACWYVWLMLMAESRT